MKVNLRLLRVFSIQLLERKKRGLVNELDVVEKLAGDSGPQPGKLSRGRKRNKLLEEVDVIGSDMGRPKRCTKPRVELTRIRDLEWVNFNGRSDGSLKIADPSGQRRDGCITREGDRKQGVVERAVESLGRTCAPGLGNRNIGMSLSVMAFDRLVGTVHLGAFGYPATESSRKKGEARDRRNRTVNDG